MTAIATADTRTRVLSALRRLDGKATVGDVVAEAGVSSDEARAGLKALLESHRGHLAVADSGEILYDFDPRWIQRGSEPLWSRIKRAVGRVLQVAFKAWIVLMLVLYFVVFVALVIAAMVAAQRGGGDRDGGWGGGGRHRHGGHFPVGNFWLWYWLMGERWRYGSPYYGRRYEKALGKKQRVPFYKKVFSFVFGPDQPEPSREQKDRSALRLIRARNGILTPAELVQHSALPLPAAEEEMARLMATYDGEPVVSPHGEVAYAFPGLMLSAHGRVATREPRPAWKRLEYPLDVTGNDTGSNLLIAGINTFNLAAAVTAPWFIFPRLGLGGTAAWIGLVVVPVVYSFLFFAVPAFRTLGIRRENRKRERRNVRRVLLGLVSEMTLRKGAGVMVDPALAWVEARLPNQPVTRKDVERELHALAAEFEAEVDPDSDGNLVFRFPRLRDQFAASEELRQSLRLEDGELGPIVFSTSDTPAEESQRDLEAFDRELGLPRGDLGRYVPVPGEVGYEDDWEVVMDGRPGSPLRD